VCFVIVTSLRIVTDGNKETTYLLTYFGTVGWVLWPVKTVSHITYTVHLRPHSSSAWQHTST